MEMWAGTKPCQLAIAFKLNTIPMFPEYKATFSYYHDKTITKLQ